MANKNLSVLLYLVVFISTTGYCLQTATCLPVFVVKNNAGQYRSNVKWRRSFNLRLG